MKNRQSFDLCDIAGSSVLVLGMGRSGTAAARFLLKRDVRVAGFDENKTVLSAKPVRRLREAGMKFTPDPVRAKADWAVVSPGISDSSPTVRALRRRGIPIVDELDLASRFVKGQVVAVTGTNGKSTTTVLIARALEAAGRRVFCGGNLAPGQPFSAALNQPAKDYYVVEASSFQLERARWFRPRVAVILNISPDHLNRHETMKHYAECKFRMLDSQTEADFAVLNHDDRLVRPAQRRGKAGKYFFSIRRCVRGAYLDHGFLCFEDEPVVPAADILLPGRHNVQNALAAVAVVRLLGIGREPIRATLRAFSGLPHRLELVRSLDGVDYINNSMCTNPAAGVSSLEAIAAPVRSGKGRGVVLIAGGREKGLPTESYVKAIARHARWAVLIGESRERLARELENRRFRRFELADNLRAAVLAARARAGHGDVVLFSPGFASFDQFKDFQARGDAFRREVARLG
jgi:UDP-N-acetylmuramoylalanine--D-glutamate ligase